MQTDIQRIRVLTDKQRAGETAESLERLMRFEECGWDDEVTEDDVRLLRELLEALRDAERGN